MASSECEVCDLTEQLSLVRRELSECQEKLTDQSYLGQVCSRVGSWIGKDTPASAQLKSTVRKLLSNLDLLSSPLDPNIKGVGRDITLKLTNKELRDLRKFVLNDDGSPGTVEDILVNSIRLKHGWLERTTEFMSQTLDDTSLHFKANYVILFQLLVVLCCVVLPLVMGRSKVSIMLFVCLYAVLTTWVRQYYTAAAKKQATLAKHGNIPYSCLLEKQGWVAAAQDFVAGLFNGRVDPCEAYYTAAMVDPAFEVGLISAVIETFSVCIVLPAQTVGSALGSYYNCLLAPLPFVWKVPVMMLATLLLLFLLLLICGYEFRIPFLLRIGPGRKRKDSGDDNYIEGERKEDGRLRWRGRQKERLEYTRHPSEECDMTDKGSAQPTTFPCPYPTERTTLDDLVEAVPVQS